MKSAHTFVYLSFPSPFMLYPWFLGLGWTPFQCLQQHDRLGMNGRRVLVFLLRTTHLIEGSALSFIAAAHWRGTPWCFSRLPIKAINRESKIEGAPVQLMFTHTHINACWSQFSPTFSPLISMLIKKMIHQDESVTMVNQIYHWTQSL